MVGKNRRCEVCGVRESLRGGFFASFPIDEHRCKIWVKQVGKEDLVSVPIEKLHEVRHVCGDHFEKRDFGKTGKRLKKRAFPKLHLSAPPLSDFQMRTFPLHVASKQVLAANPISPAESLPVELAPMPSLPSTSGGPVSTSQNINVSAANPIIPAESIPVELAPVPSLPSTSREPLSTTQNIIVLATNPTTTAASLPMEVETSQSMPSTRKKPLSTSISQNINEPIPAKRRRLENELPGSSDGPVPRPQKAEQIHQKADEIQTADDWKKEKLLKQLKQMKSTIRSLKKNAKLLENLESPFLKEVVDLALKNQKRKPRGHRWSTKHKISCLAILKRSPKAYKYLQHLVPVPSIRTLQNILQKVPIEPGISAPILEHLRKSAVSYKKNRYCCLLFDEIAIKPRLNYNVRSDNVDGYTDMGKTERSNSLADHALVFMLQGLRKKYKQPLAFYFVKGTVSSQKLAELVREVINQINQTGFEVLATVCDQGPTNMGATKLLADSSPSEDGPSVKNYFYVGNKKIFIVYDVPHLFKSVRNNFINYGELKMGDKRAKWAHLKKVEELNRNLLFLSKITLNHIEPKYRAKMKVKYAAQALSNTVAAVLKLLALAEQNSTDRQELNQTGEIIHELDQLFDCTNGPSGPHDIKKGKRQNVSKKTNHVDAWARYRKKMESMAFIKEGTPAKNVRCIKGYVTTLCSLRDLWDKLQRLGFKYLNLRQVNQDALENLFGIIRQHSPTNRNPTVSTFVAAMKTSVISGMSAPHSRGSNCDKDQNQLMTDLHNLIFDAGSNSENNSDEGQNTSNYENKENEEPELFTFHIPDDEEQDDDATNLLSVAGQPIVYMSGYLAMSILKKHDCPACKECLTEINPTDDPTYTYVKLREWWIDRSSLTYPNKKLCTYVDKCCIIFERDIIPVMHQSNISSQAVTLFMCHSDGAFVTCEVHRSKIFHEIARRLAVLLIRRQCKRINNTMLAHEEHVADKVKKSQQFRMA